MNGKELRRLAEAGWSLLEVLVVAGIAVGILLLSTPELSEALRSMKLRKEADRLEALLVEAQVLASEERVQVDLAFDGSIIGLYSGDEAKKRKRKMGHAIYKI